MNNQPRRGGARKGAGRKAKDGKQAMKRVNVTIDALTVHRLRVMGNGNMSAGVRFAAEFSSKSVICS